MKLPVCSLALLSLASSAAALSIELDFTYDTTGFFGVGSAARNAVLAAANDISAAILPSLSTTTGFYSGTSGTTTATIDWELNFENPSVPNQPRIVVDPFPVPADKFTIYVGARPLQGSSLGEGGPNGVGFDVFANSTTQLPAAFDAAEAASNAAMTRGGPVIGRATGTLNLGGTQVPYDLAYGAFLGNLWFDNDTDNNGSADSATTLNNFWHFNHTQSVGANKRDLYSVALHEILHSLGLGASLSWDQKVSGTNWLGSNVIALKGSGNGLISADGDHIANSIMGRTLRDGTVQEAVLDPDLLVGSRKFLTDVDMAFLRDIGYRTIPEPASAMMLAMGSGVLGMRRLRRRR